MNCAAIPATLLNANCLGTNAALFTGADTRRMGRFEPADHAPFSLDEMAT